MKFNINPADAHGIDLAYYGLTLARNPELQRTLEFARQLRHDVRSGSTSVPAEVDLSGMDADTAAIVSALILFARG